MSKRREALVAIIASCMTLQVLLGFGVEELRVYDTTYGAAARAALFGSQDLVFLENEKDIAHNRRRAKKLFRIDDKNSWSTNGRVLQKQFSWFNFQISVRRVKRFR